MPNRLAHETSPYLRQHADNPVEWWPWSQEAFAEALSEFVHIGGTVVLVAHELGPLQPVVSRAVVVHDGVIAHDGSVPRPAGHHAHPGHDHVHPHAPDDKPGLWGNR